MCANRGTAVWQKSPHPLLPISFPLFLSFSSPWTWTLHLSLPTPLHRRHYTQILPSPSYTTPSHNLSFIATLTLLFISVSLFTFLQPPWCLQVSSLFTQSTIPVFPCVPLSCTMAQTLLLWRMLIDAKRVRAPGHPSHCERMNIAPMSKGIRLPPNGWWSRQRIHGGFLVDNSCQHHICEKAARGAWIDALECSLWLCRDCPAGHSECGCGAHYTSQPQSSSRPQCGDKNREGCSDYL